MALNDPATKLANKISDIVESKINKKTKKSSVIKTGKVVRIDSEGIPWVSISGSEQETPVNGELLSSVKIGDSVSINIENGKCNILGNMDDPSIGSNEAKNVSNQEIKIAVEQEGTIGRAIDVESNRTIDKVDGMISDKMTPVEEAIEDLDLKSGEDIRILRGRTVSSISIAEEAKSVADATNQHFWYDDGGAHVTEVTQEEWKTSPSGFNSLFNSLGLLLRRALNNIAAFTHSAVTFYDGDGNEEENVMAMFGKEGAQVGATGKPRILITSDRLSGVNPDSVPFFDINYTGAASIGYSMVNGIETTVTMYNNSGAGNVRHLEKTLENFADLSISLSEYVIDTTRYEVGVTLLSLDGIDEVLSTDNCLVDIDTGDVTHMRFTIYPIVSFDAGTSEDIVSEVVFKNFDERNITIQITTSYDAVTKSINLSFSLTTTFTIPKPNGGVWLKPKATFACPILTTAPAFTFGSRQEGNENGDYSIAGGQGIIAPEDHQVIFGKYNSAGIDDGLVFCVGIGADDSNRANAFEVYDVWNHGVLVNVPGNFTANNILSLTSPLSIANGGTGQTSANAAAHALGMAKTAGDSVNLSGYIASGYLTNAKKSAYILINLPYRIYGVTSANCTYSGTFTARQNNLYLFGSTSTTPRNLSALTTSIVVSANGWIRMALTGSEQTNAINNNPIVFYFDSLTINFRA